MKSFTAIITEKNSPNYGESFANTKFGKYKGMSKEEFYHAVRYLQVFSFEIREM